jgi:transposase, IS5 family
MERTRLANLVNARHPMVRLARQIDWQSFDEHFGVYYRGGKGRPAISTRLMVSLHYLKYTHDLSDEAVLAGWVENPYWQYLSGMEFFEYDLPIDPSSMSRWRSRVGEAGAGELLKETIEAGLRLKIIKPSELRRVNVDTTVQEKHIRFPTDPRLYDRMRQRLVAAARREGLKLRQSYVRVGKRLLAQQSRYAHAKQWRRARGCTRKLRTILGRVIRDIERKALEPGEDLRGCSLSLGGSTVKSATIRASFIAFTPQRWSASRRARPTNATSSAARSPSP